MAMAHGEALKQLAKGAGIRKQSPAKQLPDGMIRLQDHQMAHMCLAPVSTPIMSIITLPISRRLKPAMKCREITGIFGISVGTVITHRNNIRKKLGLKPRDANLRSRLLFLD